MTNEPHLENDSAFRIALDRSRKPLDWKQKTLRSLLCQWFTSVRDVRLEQLCKEGAWVHHCFALVRSSTGPSLEFDLGAPDQTNNEPWSLQAIEAMVQRQNEISTLIDITHHTMVHRVGDRHVVMLRPDLKEAVSKLPLEFQLETVNSWLVPRLIGSERDSPAGLSADELRFLDVCAQGSFVFGLSARVHPFVADTSLLAGSFLAELLPILAPIGDIRFSEWTDADQHRFWDGLLSKLAGDKIEVSPERWKEFRGLFLSGIPSEIRNGPLTQDQYRKMLDAATILKEGSLEVQASALDLASRRLETGLEPSRIAMIPVSHGVGKKIEMIAKQSAFYAKGQYDITGKLPGLNFEITPSTPKQKVGRPATADHRRKILKNIAKKSRDLEHPKIRQQLFEAFTSAGLGVPPARGRTTTPLTWDTVLGIGSSRFDPRHRVIELLKRDINRH